MTFKLTPDKYIVWEGDDMKKFIKQIRVTQDKAREMEKKGWILEYFEMNTDGTDTYNVFENVEEQYDRH